MEYFELSRFVLTIISLSALAISAFTFVMVRRFVSEQMRVLAELSEDYVLDREALIEQLAERFSVSILELNPDKRYMVSLGSRIPDEEFEVLAESINSHLQLQGSKTKVVLTNSDLTVLEFD